MPTLLPWTTIEIGDLEIFAPAVPCLVVNTWYIDGQPDSTVTYFWQDEATGVINHEVVYAQPVGFENALQWAKEHAPTRGVERIHIKHGPSESGRPRRKIKSGQARKKLVSPAKKGGPRKVGKKTRARKVRVARK